MRSRLVALAVVLAGGTTLAVDPAQAQRARAGSAQTGEIIVEGRSMPDETDPAYVQCLRLAKDSHYRAVMAATGGSGTGIQPNPPRPTRLPRDPDYARPPTVAAGSPVPTVILDPRYTRAALDLRTNARPNASMIARGFDGMQSIDEMASASGMAPPPPASADDGERACMEAFAAGEGTPGAPYQLPDGSWMAKGMDKTFPTAMILFEQGRYAEALEWFRASSGLTGNGYGGTSAALYVGKLYLEGLGAKSDPQRAIPWLKHVATARFDPIKDTPRFDPDQPERNTDIGEAAVILGNVYARGYKGVERDPAQSYRWYKRAFDVGHIAAAKMLGDYHLNGFGTARDAKAAAAWYRKAAEFGLSAAQVALADLLSSGAPGLKRDRKQALKWYQSAAGHNHPDALLALARAYDFGDGVRADPTLALGFYKTAATNGSAPAKTALGTYFHEGKLVERNEATARAWFERAAAERDADGMFNLAAMMANGQGGEPDLASAWMWLKEAGANGNAQAPAAMTALERRMSPSERAALQPKAP